MDFTFEETDLCPNADIRVTSQPVYQLINAVAAATGKTWQTVVKDLIACAHDRACMPDSDTCVADLLYNTGFVSIADKTRNHLGKCLLYCKRQPEPQVYLVKLAGFGYYVLAPHESAPGRYVLRGPARKSRGFVDGCLTGQRDVYVDGIWVLQPQVRPTARAKERAPRRDNLSKEHMWFKPVNVNPENNRIGDCAVRALAAAYDCSWHEAVDLMVQANGYTDPVINSEANIIATLIFLGFERHSTIRRANRMLNGQSFCDLMTHLYFHGERIFAYVGPSHCAAVLAFTEPDGSVKYRIQDTWDSTTRKIAEYWLWHPRMQQTKTPKTTQVDALSCGQTITHPKFGQGEIVSVGPSLVEVRFPSGCRKLSTAWLKKQQENGPTGI